MRRLTENGRLPGTLLSIGLLAVVAGCATQQTVKPLDPDNHESILEYHQPVVPEGHKDYALNELQRGLLFFDLGDYLDADVRFANACRVIEQITGDEKREQAAVVMAESSKTYKGEPFERSMAYFYRGMCRYNLQDYSGALAAFRNSLACDAETRSKNQKDLEDFAISHVMAALCYLRLGERDNAEAALSLARMHAPTNPYLNLSSLEKNFVAVVAVGSGPYLRPSALDASIKKVDCQPCEEVKLEVQVDGRPIGEAFEVLDLLEQAKSQGWGEMDSVRLGKSIGKQVISHMPYVGMLSSLVRSEADVRCWWGLPRKLYVVAQNVPAGVHTVSLRFCGGKSESLPRYDQVWFDVPMPASGGKVMYFRSYRNLQNFHGLAATRLSRPEATADRL